MGSWSSFFKNIFQGKKPSQVQGTPMPHDQELVDLPGSNYSPVPSKENSASSVLPPKNKNFYESVTNSPEEIEFLDNIDSFSRRVGKKSKEEHSYLKTDKGNFLLLNSFTLDEWNGSLGKAFREQCPGLIKKLKWENKEGHFRLKLNIAKGHFGKVRVGAKINSDNTYEFYAVKKASNDNISNDEVEFHKKHLEQVNLPASTYVKLIEEVKAFNSKKQWTQYQILELKDRGDINSLIREVSSLKDSNQSIATLNAMWQMLKRVNAIHKQGLYHRDIKPNNFLWDSKGNISLADWGTGKAAGEGDPSVTDLRYFYPMGITASPSGAFPDAWALMLSLLQFYFQLPDIEQAPHLSSVGAKKLWEYFEVCSEGRFSSIQKEKKLLTIIDQVIKSIPDENFKKVILKLRNEKGNNEVVQDALREFESQFHVDSSWERDAKRVFTLIAEKYADSEERKLFGERLPKIPESRHSSEQQHPHSLIATAHNNKFLLINSFTKDEWENGIGKVLRDKYPNLVKEVVEKNNKYIIKHNGEKMHFAVDERRKNEFYVVEKISDPATIPKARAEYWQQQEVPIKERKIIDAVEAIDSNNQPVVYKFLSIPNVFPQLNQNKVAEEKIKLEIMNLASRLRQFPNGEELLRKIIAETKQASEKPKNSIDNPLPRP